MPPRQTITADLIQTRIREIRDGFLAALPDRVAEMERAVRSQSSAGDLVRMAHSLVGSAGTFGLPDLGAAARRLEQAALAWQAGGVNAGADCVMAFARVQGIAAGIASGALEPAPIALPPLAEAPAESLIYLLEDDPDQAADIAVQLEPYGYRIVHFAEPAGFMAAVRAGRPAALLVDVMCGADLLAGPNAVARLKVDGVAVPTIFLSARGDFQARLETVRAGGEGYVCKPVDAAILVERLDLLTGREQPEPFRILVLDDEPALSEAYGAALAAGGMEVRLISRPVEAIDAIQTFNPDLLLTDLNMPGCSGLELAAVLRQHQSLLSLPILFLTSDQQVETRRFALDLGADDFLHKSITLPVLVEHVRARARRGRQLRGLMVRDSLTGALNHAMVQELLAVEVARAHRDGDPLSFVMIDVDHFKRVNDTHGHPAGDRVLKALARMLQQRLRRTDIVGRHGGEEFAVILPRTTLEHARDLVDDLRGSLGAVSFRGRDGAAFQVTFSAGVAALTPDGDAHAVSLAADSALYVAKQAGRNLVVTA